MQDELNSFFKDASRLKRMLRNGWIYSGVPISDVESVADHSYMVSLISLIQCLEEQSKGTKINIEKALTMALIHDLSESISLDIDRRIRQFAPDDYDSFKHKLDHNATKKLMNKLPTKMREQLVEFFEEYQKKESIEARIVSEADRVETLIQLNNYIKQGLPKENFQVFYDNLSKEVENFEFDLMKNLAEEILDEE